MSSQHRIVSDRAELAADVAGNGDPVVFLHAVVGDRRMWRAQLDAVGATHKAIAYDRRGFGETRAGKEDFSAVADLMAVIDALSGDTPAILVGCSQGGRIALDAVLQHPSRIHALVLIAPSISGAADVAQPPEIQALLDQQTAAQDSGDVDRLNAVRARLWLDGPLAPEGRVSGAFRQLFLDMNATALRSPPVGANLDSTPAYQRLGEIQVPTLMIWGDLDFPHIQERSRHVAGMMPNAVAHALPGAAHLPSLERPKDITDLVVDFIRRCSPD